MGAIDITYNGETDFLVDTSHDWRKWIMDLLLMTRKEVSKDSNLEMNISFVDEDKSHRVSRDYRGEDHPTDVISFTVEDGEEGVDPSGFIEDPGSAEDIDDLFMCINVIRRHAEEYGAELDKEFGYTLIHSFLHLSGYDHIEPAEAKEMSSIQGKVLEEYSPPLYPDQLDEGRGK